MTKAIVRILKQHHITIPKHIRLDANLHIDDFVELEVLDNKIITIKKLE